ncbi:MAG: hypothetical protein ACR2KV_09035, partial [Solirubrobacteraceae bacterium]
MPAALPGMPGPEVIPGTGLPDGVVGDRSAPGAGTPDGGVVANGSAAAAAAVWRRASAVRRAAWAPPAPEAPRLDTV